jgi:hypothetical protein
MQALNMPFNSSCIALMSAIVGGLLGGFLLDMQWGKRSIKKLQTKQAEDLKVR